jgi:hypothetical protein
MDLIKYVSWWAVATCRGVCLGGYQVRSNSMYRLKGPRYTKASVAALRGLFFYGDYYGKGVAAWKFLAAARVGAKRLSPPQQT